MTTPKIVVLHSSLDLPVAPQSDAALTTAPKPSSVEFPGVYNETGQMQLSDTKSEPVPIQQGVRRSQRQGKRNSKYKDFIVFK